MTIQTKALSFAISAFICMAASFAYESAAQETKTLSPPSLQKKPILKVSEIGLPRGHDSPEGVAVDLALAFILRDAALLRDTCIPPSFAEGEYRKAYEGFLNSAEAHIKAEAAKSVPSPEGPQVIGKLWAVRHFSRNGPTSTGYALFGFQDVPFVDV